MASIHSGNILGGTNLPRVTKFHESGDPFDFLSNVIAIKTKVNINNVDYNAASSEAVFQAGKAFANGHTGAAVSLLTTANETGRTPQLFGQKLNTVNSHYHDTLKDAERSTRISFRNNPLYNIKYTARTSYKGDPQFDSATVKEAIMLDTILMKITQNPEIARMVIKATQQNVSIIEDTAQLAKKNPGAAIDDFWGLANGDGRNALGISIMVAGRVLNEELKKTGKIQVRSGFSPEISQLLNIHSQQFNGHTITAQQLQSTKDIVYTQHLTSPQGQSQIPSFPGVKADYSGGKTAEQVVLASLKDRRVNRVEVSSSRSGTPVLKLHFPNVKYGRTNPRDAVDAFIYDANNVLRQSGIADINKFPGHTVLNEAQANAIFGAAGLAQYGTGSMFTQLINDGISQQRGYAQVPRPASQTSLSSSLSSLSLSRSPSYSSSSSSQSVSSTYAASVQFRISATETVKTTLGATNVIMIKDRTTGNDLVQLQFASKQDAGNFINNNNNGLKAQGIWELKISPSDNSVVMNTKQASSVFNKYGISKQPGQSGQSYDMSAALKNDAVRNSRQTAAQQAGRPGHGNPGVRGV